MKKEEWKEITGYPNYMVSNMGRVKSLNYNHTGREKILKPSVDKRGYLQVVLYQYNRELSEIHNNFLFQFVAL